MNDETPLPEPSPIPETPEAEPVQAESPDAKLPNSEPSVSSPAPSLKEDAFNVGRGFLMGGADIIPGVSGGTVALILGIYSRLVTAITRFDVTLLGHLRNRNWKAAVEYSDLRFVATLGFGILVGIVGLASVMHYLLLHQRVWTLAAFFGIIAASSLLVFRLVKNASPLILASIAISAAFAFWLVGLPFLQSPPDNLAYIFFCGFVGICAMILPGISGAFILLLLGKYAEITGTIKGFKSLDVTGGDLLMVMVFGCGCVVGLLSFSRVLKWVLSKYESITMAILGGFMIGSLRKLWPFQKDLTPEVEELKHKVFVNLGFDQISIFTEFMPAIAIAILAGAAVIGLDYFTGGEQKIEHADEELE